MNTEAPLFYTYHKAFYGRRLKTGGATYLLKKYALKCGITKKVHPHLLRHSRLDFLAKVENFNERDLRIFAGWSNNSDMPNVYLHYGENELDKKILALTGRLKEQEKQYEEQRQILKPKICVKCSRENPADSLYCNCGMILDSKEALRIDAIKKDADDFTEKLMTTPIKKDINLEQGMMEALFQTMLADKRLMKKFKLILNKIKNN